MNQAHLHVALNHFPVVGAIIATAIMLFGLFKKNDKTKEIALWLFVAIAAIAIPVLFTGKNAAELVEHLPAVSEETIETHE